MGFLCVAEVSAFFDVVEEGEEEDTETRDYPEDEEVHRCYVGVEET